MGGECLARAWGHASYNDCSAWAGWCSDPYWGGSMAPCCQRTCGLCTSSDQNAASGMDTSFGGQSTSLEARKSAREPQIFHMTGLALLIAIVGQIVVTLALVGTLY